MTSWNTGIMFTLANAVFELQWGHDDEVVEDRGRAS